MYIIFCCQFHNSKHFVLLLWELQRQHSTPASDDTKWWLISDTCWLSLHQYATVLFAFIIRVNQVDLRAIRNKSCEQSLRVAYVTCTTGRWQWGSLCCMLAFHSDYFCSEEAFGAFNLSRQLGSPWKQIRHWQSLQCKHTRPRCCFADNSCKFARTEPPRWPRFTFWQSLPWYTVVSISKASPNTWAN